MFKGSALGRNAKLGRLALVEQRGSAQASWLPHTEVPQASTQHIDIHKRDSGVIDFEDPCTVFASKSASDLLKSCLVLSSCRFGPLVRNAKSATHAANAVLGSRLTTKLVEKTYFDHFCAGFDEASMKPKLANLRQKGIMAILNYAAEDDVAHEVRDWPALEHQRELNAQRFVNCTQLCNTQTHPAFLALKITALADPNLLARMSQALLETGSNTDRGHSSSRLDALMQFRLVKSDFEAYLGVRSRLERIARAVKAKGRIRMMIDAEATNIQPAIDALVIALQQQYNREEAMVFNTYQCYLKDSEARIDTDMRRSLAEGWHWGAKTVRGAYLVSEKQRAQEKGEACPIHNTMNETHTNYNRCVGFVLEHVAKGGAQLMVATHNQQSVESAISNMQKLSLKAHNPASGVFFGQLLGMADNLTYPLGAHGYNAYKMCAYGGVDQCMDFLIRRVVENSDALGGCEREIKLARSALISRFTSGLFRQEGSTRQVSTA